jgi:hypothetical protein
MINFYCPLGQRPNGGHKVIYNAVEELNSLNINARVLHPIPNYRLKWFNSKAKVNSHKKIKSSEYFIIPEICLSLLDEYKILNHSKYSILVQNGYLYLGTENPRESIKKFYENADFIFCVSQDTLEVITMLFPDLSKKIILFEPLMTKFLAEKFDPVKMKIISYMPRKNPLYSDIVVNMLKLHLPKKWEIIAISGQPENKVIELLKKSSIFLSFSGLEGNPLPPLEAAILGNIVIGNHGNGAKSYWNEPLFIKVNQDDIKEYVKKTLEMIKQIDLDNNINSNYEDSRLDLISSLKERTSLATVISNLIASKQLNTSQLKEEVEYSYSISFYRYLSWRIRVKLKAKSNHSIL